MPADIVAAEGNGIGRDRSYAIPGSDVREGVRQRARARSRLGIYFGGAAGLVILFVLLRGSDWQGSATLHTIMEAVATLLAMFVGILALVRYYSQKNTTILLIGLGFLGAAFLDGYHAVITAWISKDLFPPELSNLTAWSWLASRLYLSLILFRSVIA